MLACDYGLSPSVQIYCTSGCILGVCIPVTWGECLLEPALHSKPWSEHWGMYMENQRNWLLKNPPGWNLDLVKGVEFWAGLWGVKGVFLLLGSTVSAPCSHHGTAWGPFQNPAGQLRSLKETLKMQIKTPKMQRAQGVCSWFWMHLLSHLATSSVCCFSPVPQATQGLTASTWVGNKKRYHCSYWFWNTKVSALKARRNK